MSRRWGKEGGRGLFGGSRTPHSPFPLLSVTPKQRKERSEQGPSHCTRCIDKGLTGEGHTKRSSKCPWREAAGGAGESEDEEKVKKEIKEEVKKVEVKKEEVKEEVKKVED